MVKGGIKKEFRLKDLNKAYISGHVTFYVSNEHVTVLSPDLSINENVSVLNEIKKYCPVKVGLLSKMDGLSNFGK
jgi:hypothetical protein